MIFFYCADIELRRRIHYYFREENVFVESIGLSELEIAAWGADADAILTVGEVPVGLLSCIDPRLPVVAVGRHPIGDSIYFRDYKDPELLDLLKGFLSRENLAYNDVLFQSGEDVIYLGYALCLTLTERSILDFLLKYPETGFSPDELTHACIGDIHLAKTNIARHVCRINKKARVIGGRDLIECTDHGFYRMAKYI
ncbi:MAG: helix-turn-helix domain-containing protein [Eubacteriales bacterium]